MRAFAEAFPDREIVQQAVARWPWGHAIKLVEELKGDEQRLWYARQAADHGRSRNVRVHQIESDLCLPGQGADELCPDPAGAAIRPRSAADQGSLQLRCPGARARDVRARTRAWPPGAPPSSPP
ncbi:DUF1016 N-terminal domain-containing protein [Methylobacterium tarhaniae]|uniref:DUF1016 N-terminal domain-containing protein n=1 Tax=Methylobacterium tarhaniae TaxID=1187852 RepID=UPI001FDA4497|nr:DUF1016 N-terminal domain-containing protein [Methylobacterium tarhaniae]